MNTEHAEQSQILTIGKTPAQWVEIMAAHGIKISERTLREKANDTGAFFRLGRTMLITPAQIDTIFEEGQAVHVGSVPSVDRFEMFRCWQVIHLLLSRIDI
jgi:hypothetical protein